MFSNTAKPAAYGNEALDDVKQTNWYERLMQNLSKLARDIEFKTILHRE